MLHFLQSSYRVRLFGSLTQHKLNHSTQPASYPFRRYEYLAHRQLKLLGAASYSVRRVGSLAHRRYRCPALCRRRCTSRRIPGSAQASPSAIAWLLDSAATLPPCRRRKSSPPWFHSLHYSCQRRYENFYQTYVTLPFSSETTTTYTTVPVQLTEKKTVPPSKIPSSNFPYIYPVSLLVLGSVLFLALVLLVVLFYQNRVLRRVISKARRKTLLEAVYEEINHKCVTNRYTKRGSFISEDQHSGYEDVDEELLSENYGEVYDIIPAEESPHITTDYDDVVEDVQMSEEDE
ncbi:uncharacterized protein LOC125801750 [Astyanax mexicanus]|uniref:uncharacterized protein LOC125801750 n=1 Tax=Astyanax mexicanus TaxID=7994 RepID=UPI0020CB2B8A|nr:uncharacterized protein LOC125801750 [Astyanax mexicanus]